MPTPKKEVKVTPELKKYGELMRQMSEKQLVKLQKTVDREIALAIAEARRIQKICSGGVITAKEWTTLTTSAEKVVGFFENGEGGLRKKVDKIVRELDESLEENADFEKIGETLEEQFKDFKN